MTTKEIFDKVETFQEFRKLMQKQKNVQFSKKQIEWAYEVLKWNKFHKV